MAAAARMAAERRISRWEARMAVEHRTAVERRMAAVGLTQAVRVATTAEVSGAGASLRGKRIIQKRCDPFDRPLAATAKARGCG
jgi:hypothetical protein